MSSFRGGCRRCNDTKVLCSVCLGHDCFCLDNQPVVGCPVCVRIDNSDLRALLQKATDSIKLPVA